MKPRHIILIIFLLISLILWIIRKSRNNSSQIAGARLLEMLRHDPSRIKVLAEELIFNYGNKKSVTSGNLALVLKNLDEKKQLGRFKILGIFEFAPQRYFVITTLSDLELTLGMNRRMSQEEAILDYNFVVLYNTELQQYEVYSESYDNLNEKNNLTDFGYELFKTLD